METGLGSGGSPVRRDSSAGLTMVTCRRAPASKLYAVAGKVSRMIFCEICPPAAKPCLYSLADNVEPPPRRRKTRCNVPPNVTL